MQAGRRHKALNGGQGRSDAWSERRRPRVEGGHNESEDDRMSRYGNQICHTDTRVKNEGRPSAGDVPVDRSDRD